MLPDPGSVSRFHEVDPDPPKWRGSGWIHNTVFKLRMKKIQESHICKLTYWLACRRKFRFSVIKYNLIMYRLGPLWSCCGLEGAHREDWREDWRESFNRSPDQEDLPRRGRRTDKRNSSHSKYGLLINGLDVNTYAWVMISWRIQGSLIKVGFGGYQEHLFLFINNFKVIVSVKSR